MITPIVTFGYLTELQRSLSGLQRSLATSVLVYYTYGEISYVNILVEKPARNILCTCIIRVVLGVEDISTIIGNQHESTIIGNQHDK